MPKAQSSVFDDIIKPGLVLFIITLVAGLGLGLVYNVTKEPIRIQEELKQNKGMQEILAEAESFTEGIFYETRQLGGEGGEALPDTITLAFTGHKGQAAPGQAPASESIVGYILRVAPRGYGGAIPMLVALDVEGRVVGVKILDISTETPGLGANAVNAFFLDQYKGKASTLSVTKTKSPETIEALTSATITSRGVTEGVNRAIEYFQAIKEGK